MLQIRARNSLHPVELSRPALRSLATALVTLARRHPLALIIGAMLAIDVAFIAIQIAVDATDYGFNGAFRLSLETEMGVAQFYGWIKAGAGAYLLLIAWRRFRSPTSALWAAAMAYLGIDDALRLHERLGSYFAETFGLGEVGPLRGQDVGEALAYLVILSLAVAALVVAERQHDGPIPSMLTKVMLPVVAVFVFFAVVVDTLGGSVLPHVIAIAVEDGGELVMLTLMFAVAAIWSQEAEALAELSS